MPNSSRPRIRALFFLAFALAAVLPTAMAATPTPRSVVSFDRGWRFRLGDAVGADQAVFDDTGWRTLDLPHDWMIEGPFDRNSPAGSHGAYLDGGIGWYRKTFTLPPAARGRRISLLFDGAYMNSTVWLNGQKLGDHPYGFSSFSYDLTPFLNFGAGKNVVAVRLDVEQPSCRWYSGAGLYRHLWLVSTEAVHVAQGKTYITTPQVGADGGPALVRVQTQVNNDSAAPTRATLTTRLLAPDGREVGNHDDTQVIAPGGAAAFDQTIPVPHARLWSLETPLLYHAVSNVRVGTTLTDTTTTPFGVRTIAFTKDRGFLLNGRRVQIKGVCLHQDLGCLGAVALASGYARQLQILRGMGCNAIRTSHDPPPTEFLDLCDRMGFLVMDESFDEWKFSKRKYGYGQFFDQWSGTDLTAMLDRDRDHPSIILWSIGNEISEGAAGNPIAGPEAQRLAAICHREDPTRPVTSACPAVDNDWKSGLAQALDVFGVNYNTYAYGLNDPATPPAPPDPTRYHGELPMIGSETASQVDSRGEYGLTLDAGGAVVLDPRPGGFQLSDYDQFHPAWACSAETDLLAVKNAPWVAGEFVWTGFDYLGETTPFDWPSRSSYFGIIDMDGFPKDRYYLYKSQWSAAPLVHLLPSSWTWPGFVGKPIPVRVFTNADTVELFLNGRSLGEKTFATQAVQLHLEWSVPYAPGELRAVAKRAGQVVATDVLRTAAAPARITLAPDRTRIAGDGEDLAFVTVTVLDKDGIVCPDADTEVHFTLRGAAASLAGVDDGDSTNHESFQGTQHQAFHGLALAVLKSRRGAGGPVTLTASADGLSPATTTIQVVAGETDRPDK